jgi:O-antigen ligase
VAFAAAGLVRGKLFLVMVAASVAGVAALFPEVVPESLQARVAQSQQEGSGGTGPELDDSAETRLILWHAAIEMTKESPILGKGFGMFPRLKAYYTEVPVRESDNHNMFLFIASQMGVPALLAFLWVIVHIFITGVRLHQRAGDSFGRGIGLGGAALAGALVGINMFGSRMTDFCVMAYVWVYMAVLTRVWGELVQSDAGTPVPQPARVLRYCCEDEEHRQ